MKEETKELLVRCTDVLRRIVHFGFVPLILYLGYTRSSPRPPLMRLINPLM